MEPGRELDALVAEKVMGLEITKIANGHMWFRDGVTLRSPIPHYSTDIAAAWLVVEKMSSDGWIHEITEHINDSQIKCAMFANRSGHYESYERSWDDEQWAVSGTAPHAICLAALKAVGIEV